MKIKYEILIWIGSCCPNIDLRYFELDEASEALQTFKENVSIAKEYLRNNPDDEGLPYLTIKRWNRYGDDFIEYGNGSYFDRDLTELPKYVQKKCADLIAYELSEK